MSKDTGDRIPGDLDDVAPDSPLNGLNTLNNRDRPRKAIKLHRLSDFDPDQRAPSSDRKPRDYWWGNILDVDTFRQDGLKKFYEVMLQDGSVVEAYYPDQVEGDKWKEGQLVQIGLDASIYIILTPPLGDNQNLWWKATELLLPGGAAKGKMFLYDEDEGEFKDQDSTITVEETEPRNFVLPDEKVQVRASIDKYEPIGCFGLFRKAKTKVAISPGSSGLVYVYAKGIKAKNQNDVDVEVTAWLNWTTGGKTLNASKECLINYFPDEEKWIIVGRDC